MRELGRERGRWLEWWEALFKALLPCLFWVGQTTRGAGKHFVHRVKNGLVAKGHPLHPICFTTVGGGSSTQRNTCCRSSVCRSADSSSELAVIRDPSLKLHAGHFLQTVTPADTSDSARMILKQFEIWGKDTRRGLRLSYFVYR